MSKIVISQGIIVEGKYDKIKLESFLDALIIVTNGFSIFKDEGKKKYLKKIADERGLLVLTDSDGAGFLIRNHLKSFISEEKIFNAYVPNIFGKEKRKKVPSKEGTLGVEGIDKEVILTAIRNSGISFSDSYEEVARKYIYTATDLFNLGLTGTSGSKERKEKFLESLSLPKYMSNKALILYMNTAREDEIQKVIDYIMA